MTVTPTFEDRIVACTERMAPAERRVARYFGDHREEVLVASAAALAEKAATSDATVVRTARALGFAGLEALRRALAEEVRVSLTLSERLMHTLDEAGGTVAGALATTMELHRRSLESLVRSIAPAQFERAVADLVAARRVVVFGLGPSNAIAGYFAMQLQRFGCDATTVGNSGLLFADDLGRLRAGDLVVMLAYGRVYAELEALLDATGRDGLGTILITDTLAGQLGDRVGLVLAVPRGRADLVSMHTATLGFLEALLVGVAAARPGETAASLERLNAARARLAGRPHDLPDGRARGRRERSLR